MVFLGRNKEDFKSKDGFKKIRVKFKKLKVIL